MQDEPEGEAGFQRDELEPPVPGDFANDQCSMVDVLRLRGVSDKPSLLMQIATWHVSGQSRETSHDMRHI